ncbi:DUF2079 domain-containing protein [Symbioplanes lichenis]|uniref:DUF2079 domain-containing protein n=1 Tax=Symbioplanes lichenis TaxID=1629072 RepID=UPI00273874FA|nr:DUF2079 domain-containing protein [Actinoplanes lichenis]
MINSSASRLLAWIAAATLAVVYGTCAVLAHLRFRTTGFDLGIFEQVVRSYTQGRPGLTALKGEHFPQLGDHFSPALVVLAPAYRIFPSPLTLLVAQALLFAVAVVPIIRYAHRVLGGTVALVVAAGYGLSSGIGHAVGFDFHEICLAVPLLAFSLGALAEGRHTATALWALPLVLVKEDLGLTVAVIGVLLAVRGARRAGVALAAFGIAGTLLAVLVVIPALNPNATYAYTTTHGAGLFATAVTGAPIKATTVLVLLAPTALLALRSPLSWVVLPTLAWRFMSDNANYWGTGFHYSAVLMPIASLTFADGLRRWRISGHRLTPPLAAGLAVTLALLPWSPLVRLVEVHSWRPDPRIAAAHRVLHRIPDDVTVDAANHLVPHLTARAEVRLVGTTAARPAPDYILVDTTRPGFPLSLDAQRLLTDRAIAGGYRILVQDSGFLLLERPGVRQP